MLLLNAILGVGERALLKVAEQGPSSPVAHIFDAIIGVMLLRSQEKALPWAKVRAGLGLIVLPALFFSKGDSITAVMQLAYCASLLALLFGDAGRLRLAVAGLALTGVFSLEGLGVVALATGRNLLPRLDVEPAAIMQVEGRDFRYRLTAPSGSWHVRKDESVRKDNAAADRWLVRPDRDAHLLVIAETVPGSGPIEMDAFADIVVKNSQSRWKAFRLIGQTPLSTGLEAGRLLHTDGTIDNLDVECYHGLYIQGRSIFQVWAFVDKRNFAAVKDDFEKLIGSFELTAP